MPICEETFLCRSKGCQAHFDEEMEKYRREILVWILAEPECLEILPMIGTCDSIGE